ncbi:MAG: hypothetical protein M3Y93_10970, partial [Pseudomonadota bacterium]|nr:hypothetical protein [Pseudomonadota bacterium]
GCYWHVEQGGLDGIPLPSVLSVTPSRYRSGDLKPAREVQLMPGPPGILLANQPCSADVSTEDDALQHDKSVPTGALSVI